MWIIKINDTTVKSNDIVSIYFRRAFLELSIEEMQLESDINFKLYPNEFNTILNGLWYNLKSKKVLNPLRNAYLGENKFLQSNVARQVGFNIPDTVISNDFYVLKEFIVKHSEVIFKLYNQGVYVENNILKGMYTNKITLNDLYEKFSGIQNPIVLQEYIEKAFEVR